MASLAGLTIVVTRPHDSAVATAGALSMAGANAIALPLLELSAIESSGTALTLPPDVIIFVSSHAAAFGVAALSRQRMIANRQAGQQIFAIGRATATQLASLGIGNAMTPAAGEDSEALLAEALLANPAGRTVVIVKGRSAEGGRALLADTLAGRGATVVEFVCYERRARHLDAADSATLGRAVRDGATVLIGSIETLSSLTANLADQRLKIADVAHILVPHARVVAAAAAAGARRVTVVSLEDNKLIETLVKQAA